MSLAAGAHCNLAMHDTWGDGWNGNHWVGFGADCTIEEGKDGECEFTVEGDHQGPPPMVSTDINCDGGEWQSEVSWSLNCGSE